MAERAKILIVDDDPFNVDLLEQDLEDLGYETITATNGQEALDLFETQGQNIALVLTDVVMPRMGGPEMVALAASKGSFRILYMSGYTDEAIVHHGILD